MAFSLFFYFLQSLFPLEFFYLLLALTLQLEGSEVGYRSG